MRSWVEEHGEQQSEIRKLLGEAVAHAGDRAEALMALSKRGRERAIDYWPGFVDALSTLLLVFTFLLSVFMIAQFFLTQEITGKENILNRLTTQIKQLSELLVA